MGRRGARWSSSRRPAAARPTSTGRRAIDSGTFLVINGLLHETIRERLRGPLGRATDAGSGRSARATREVRDDRDDEHDRDPATASQPTASRGRGRARLAAMSSPIEIGRAHGPLGRPVGRREPGCIDTMKA